MNKSQIFLGEVRARLVKLGHRPGDWIKGRWGFHTVCSECGAFTAVTAYKRTVREIPEDTCEERQVSVTNWMNDRERRIPAHD